VKEGLFMHLPCIGHFLTEVKFVDRSWPMVGFDFTISLPQSATVTILCRYVVPSINENAVYIHIVIKKHS